MKNHLREQMPFLFDDEKNRIEEVFQHFDQWEVRRAEHRWEVTFEIAPMSNIVPILGLFHEPLHVHMAAVDCGNCTYCPGLEPAQVVRLTFDFENLR